MLRDFTVSRKGASKDYAVIAHLYTDRAAYRAVAAKNKEDLLTRTVDTSEEGDCMVVHVCHDMNKEKRVYKLDSIYIFNYRREWRLLATR